MQGIIPGILHGDQLSSLLYGSVDSAKTVAWDSELHDKLGLAASRMHIREHPVPITRSILR